MPGRLGNNNLSLKALLGKLAILMALVAASHTSELQALDLRYRVYKPEGILFKFVENIREMNDGFVEKVAATILNDENLFNPCLVVGLAVEHNYNNVVAYRCKL